MGSFNGFIQNMYGGFSFLGFTYGAVHSSEFGLYRVTSGDRYTIDLSPTLTSKTIHVPGQEGSYFFGAEYKQKTFPIDVAFDEMTELGLNSLRAWLTGGIQDLVFDETPYKAYYAKPDGAQDLKIIPYTKGNDTLYKGEGTINFTCYYPFSHSTYKFLEDYRKAGASDVTSIFNIQPSIKFTPDWEKEEWAASTRLLESRVGTDNQIIGDGVQTITFSYDSFRKGGLNQNLDRYYWYNAGDFSAYPLIYVRIQFASDLRWFALSDVRNKKYPFQLKDGSSVLANKNGEIKQLYQFVFNVTDYPEIKSGIYEIFINTQTKNVTLYNEKTPNIILSGNKYCTWAKGKRGAFEMPPTDKTERNFFLFFAENVPKTYELHCKYRYEYK